MGVLMLRKTTSIICGAFSLLMMVFGPAFGGPYAPAAQESGSSALYMDEPAFISWAVAVAGYTPGDKVDPTWQTPQKALGKAEGNSFDVVSLGEGGTITLLFDPPIENGTGWDFAVFENSFSDFYLELAYVEVSSNGVDFVRFDSVSLTSQPVTGFGNLDPTNVDGLAGKYRQGFGTPFDLEALADKAAVVGGAVDLSAITHVRIVDITGDGSCLDSREAPIYDPYPTTGSAGFDLDAVGVLRDAPMPEEEYVPPTPPAENGEAGFGNAGGCFVHSLWQ
jgi:hypothetical protein